MRSTIIHMVDMCCSVANAITEFILFLLCIVFYPVCEIVLLACEIVLFAYVFIKVAAKTIVSTLGGKKNGESEIL